MGSNNRQMAPSPTATPAPVAGGLPPSGQQGALLQPMQPPMQAPMQAPEAPVSGVTPMPNVSGGMPPVAGGMPPMQANPFGGGAPQFGAAKCPTCGK